MKIMTTQKKAHDVLVIGGGIAGISAAVSAARLGKSVLLIEKGINLGGLATVGLISWYEPLCDGEGRQMIGGICEELIKLAVSCGFDTLPAAFGGEERVCVKKTRYATYFSPTLFELALNKYITDAGVELLLDSRVTFPDMDGNICRGVYVENVSGREFYPASIVIDATGDATVCHRAGVPCRDGDNYLCYVVHEYTKDGARDYVNRHGDPARFRKWRNSGASLDGVGHPDGMKHFVGTDADEITEFILLGKLRLMEKYEELGLDRFEHDIMMIPQLPQFRKIRCICGESSFDGSVEAFDCEDCIGAVGDFRYSGKHYALPYGTLWNKAFPNLLAAGRIISSVDDGWEITRVIPVCALTGQAAGVAAAMCIENGCAVGELEHRMLRQRLKNSGVIFWD